MGASRRLDKSSGRRGYEGTSRLLKLAQKSLFGLPAVNAVIRVKRDSKRAEQTEAKMSELGWTAFWNSFSCCMRLDVAP